MQHGVQKAAQHKANDKSKQLSSSSLTGIIILMW